MNFKLILLLDDPDTRFNYPQNTFEFSFDVYTSPAEL